MDAWLDEFMAREGADDTTRAAVVAFFGERSEDSPPLGHGRPEGVAR